jgi:serine/threonine protein phosphatase PrpC
MEDALLALPAPALAGLEQTSFFGVFDGHGGPSVSKAVARDIVPAVHAVLTTDSTSGDGDFQASDALASHGFHATSTFLLRFSFAHIISFQAVEVCKMGAAQQ